MSRSRKHQRQKKAKEYRHGRIELPEHEAKELVRKNAFQFDKLHEGGWKKANRYFWRAFERKRNNERDADEIREHLRKP